MSVGYWSTIMNSQLDGTALTAAAAASCLPAAARPTLPTSFFDAPGKKLIIEATGRVSTVITTPGTIRFDLRFGATVVFDGLAILPDTVAAHTNVGWTLRIDLTARVIGSAGNLIGQGVFTCEDILGVPATAPKGVLSAILPWNTAPAVGNNFDTTATQQLDMFFTQTVGTGSLTVHQFAVYDPTTRG
jgi:hypothetical protein